MTEFRRTPDELRTVASIWWPSDLVSQEADASIIPRLLSTQDKFISLIHVADSGPEAWVSVLEHTQGLPGNLFLKHLMVLADVGGEPLKRLPPVLKKIFPKGSMSYLWGGKRFGYAFKSLLSAKLDNKKLRVDGASLANEHALSPLMLDVSILIMHGGTAEENLPGHLVEKCIIGSMIGRKDELSRFVKQRYILVSRITGGATANKMGQITQDAVLSHLRDALPIWAFKRNGTIPGISQTSGKTLTSFDIVAKSPHGRFVAIEVSFQVTTNSTIERKAGQAVDRAKTLRKNGHLITYVLDGAGNFERAAFMRTICENSDCTVAMTPKELDVLCDFLRSLEQPADATRSAKNAARQ